MPAVAPVVLMILVSFAPRYIGATLPFKDQCLKWHNEYRSAHQVGNVTWNDKLAEGAEEWANYLADNNKFEHKKNIQPGENLYLSGSPLPTEPCTEATQLFYGEIKDYDFNKPGFALNTGHFTQVVWKNTKEIGAAVKTRKDGRLIVVIRYSPAGNFVGEENFRKNVLPKKGWVPPTEAGAPQTCFNVVFACLVLFVGIAFNYVS